MDFVAFVQQFGNGIMLGSLFALIAIGYTMVYGILRLINFAHSNIFMMAMYFSFYCVTIFLIPWYFAFILVIIATMLLGILTERAAYRPLRQKGAPKISMLTSAIGMSYLLENLAVVLFTGRPKAYPDITVFTDVMVLGPIRLQRLAVIVPVLTIALLIILMYLINKTRMGMAMRAVAKNSDAAQLMGIDINTTITFTFGVGSALAAIGAIFFGMRYPQMTPTIGMMPGIKCFIAAVLGGIGNIKGAVIGGFLLGILEVMLVAFFPTLTSYRDAFAFIILILILLVKPTGLIGEKIGDKV